MVESPRVWELLTHIAQLLPSPKQVAAEQGWGVGGAPTALGLRDEPSRGLCSRLTALCSQHCG